MTEEPREVKMLRRSRATGGKVLLPGKTYTVSAADWRNLIRSGKGMDPTGKIRPPQRRRSRGKYDEEYPGGKGESEQTLGSSTPSTDPATRKKDKPTAASTVSGK